MKVIKKGKLRLAACPYCDTILQYDINNDVEEKYKTKFYIDAKINIKYKYVICPICNQEIEVEDKNN